MTTHRNVPYAEYAADLSLRSNEIIAMIESPQLFKDRRDGLVEKRSKTMTFGIAGHMNVMEPGRFQKVVVLQPETYTNDKRETKPWSNNANVCKAWHAEQEATGLTVVTQSDLARLDMMQRRMPDEVRAIFAEGDAETVIRVADGDLRLQCRIDWFRPKHRRWHEFKTIGHINAIDKAIHSYGYHFQQAFYQRCLNIEAGTGGWQKRIVFAETNAPFRWRVVELDIDYQHIAQTAVSDALDQIRARTKSGEWQDALDTYMLVSPPAWMDVDAIDEESGEMVLP